MAILTAELLRHLLDYDKTTGEFTWKNPKAKCLKPGAKAGSHSSGSGYVYIEIDYQPYGAHRLAWLHSYGEWPKYEIDHINGDTSDNRLENLQHVTHRENVRKGTNQPVEMHGIYWNTERQKYHVQFDVKGKRRFFGRFADKETAIAKAVEVKAKFNLY